jgi:MerR family transcriptional regulator/heat shock protein HspR
MTADERTRPLFMISVAAELAEMHPQTLRLYERKGLIRPRRSSKKTRLYSMDDVDRLRTIQRLTTEIGLNLAGVERVLELEDRLDQLLQRVAELEQQVVALGLEADLRVEETHRSYRRELVPLPRHEIVVHMTRAKRSNR